MRRVLITGSSGLIGYEAVTFFDERRWEVHGGDNNMRRVFFGPDADTTWNLKRHKKVTRHFVHYDLDIRDREVVIDLISRQKPDLIIHCAVQPLHDLAENIILFEDHDINAVGTLILLEVVRQHCEE